MTWEFDDLPVKTALPNANASPRNISLSSIRIPTIVEVDLFNVFASWQQPLLDNAVSPWAIGYVAEIKKGQEGIWEQTRTTTDLFTTFENMQPGNYYVRVRAIFFDNSLSDWTESV